MSVQSFRDLRVWQSGMQLAVAVYELTRKSPKSETYGLSSQMQRAAVSIPANIAEGHSRQHLGEYLQFLSIGRGSRGDLETYLDPLPLLAYATPAETRSVLDLAGSVSRQLVALRSSLSSLLKEESIPYDELFQDPNSARLPYYPDTPSPQHPR